ncbi:hypothetical protein B2J93_8556 [Marssonina coronariae]|uniref:Uncharacterized protein n=1 Tax=Diplocarpon coronariae TaxID=2795749 RepID=A0A218YVW9_9HELO|nr:hypothetical protein B2J93_8556 [Marssonina coronariae]
MTPTCASPPTSVRKPSIPWDKDAHLPRLDRCLLLRPLPLVLMDPVLQLSLHPLLLCSGLEVHELRASLRLLDDSRAAASLWAANLLIPAASSSALFSAASAARIASPRCNILLLVLGSQRGGHLFFLKLGPDCVADA